MLAAAAIKQKYEVIVILWKQTEKWKFEDTGIPINSRSKIIENSFHLRLRIQSCSSMIQVYKVYEHYQVQLIECIKF